VTDPERDRLADRAAALIDRASAQGSSDHESDQERDALLLDQARFQARRIEPYRRLLQARGADPETATTPNQLPAIPTDLFRHARLAAHPAEQDVRIFRTSGTTTGRRGAHHLKDLTLYDRAARAAAGAALFPDGPLTLIHLIPSEAEAPDSSLAYMAARFQDWFGKGPAVHAWEDDRLHPGRLAEALDQATAEARPVALLGTSFAFVQAEEILQSRWILPPGSRLMQTGGFKGRTREVAPDLLRQLLSDRYGLPDQAILAEYGMTELSSQLYETTGPRRLRPPAWLRIEIVDPETLQPIPPGQQSQAGLLRIEDPANVDTAWAIQTSDLARQIPPDGLELLGRAPGAIPRGCSLAVEEALGR
jgi:Acyl-protein synthetase, LuxE